MKNIVVLHSELPENSLCGLGGRGKFERVWAAPLDIDACIYRLDSIPSCDPDLNYLDEVKVEALSTMRIVGIHRRGGQRTFGIHFSPVGIFDFLRKSARRDLLATIRDSVGGKLESFTSDWYGASVPKDRNQDMLRLLGVAIGADIVESYSSSGTFDRWAKNL